MSDSVRLRILRCLLVCIVSLLSTVTASAQQAKLIIFAAASLKDVLDEVNAAYRATRVRKRPSPMLQVRPWLSRSRPLRPLIFSSRPI